jgi:predicted PurR-regulated permease PerM
MSSASSTAGARPLLTFASAIVVIAGLRAATAICVPLLLGLFFAILSLPLAEWLENRGVRRSWAIFLALLAGVAVVGVLVLFLSAALGELTEAAPIYQVRLQRASATTLAWLQERGLAAPEWTPRDLVRLATSASLVGGTLRSLAAILSDVVLIVLTMAFVMLEAAGFNEKLRAAFGREEASDPRFGQVTREMQRYLGVKTVMSLATGILVGAWVAFVGLDFPVLWGFLAFVFHYIPNIGAILAAAPAVLLGIIQFGLGGAALVALGYLVIDMVLGNVIEPQWLGHRLGLSPLVVFLSLVFWGFVWGAVGMFLSVPLTLTAKILVERTPGMEWLATLLGPNPAPLEPEPSA